MNTLIFSSAILPLVGALFLEGTSIPFPGILIVLAFASAARPSFKETMAIGAIMALAYTIASFIPYAIGRIFGPRVLSIFDKRKKVKASIEKGKIIVEKYGVVTMAISRFFGWGNRISYIAGISKIDYIPYSGLTFLGIYTWSVIMLNLGKIFKGDTKFILNLIEQYTIYIYIIVGIVVIIYFLLALIKCKNKKNA